MKTKEELEAEAQAKAQEELEFEASLEGLSEEEKTEKLAERQALLQNNTDEALQQELEAERQKRKDAEEKFEETRRKSKERWEQRKREAEERGETIEDEPLTRQSFQEMLDEEREKTRKETRSEHANEIAYKLANGNSQRAELIVEIWKNRTLSGSLEEQLSEANAIISFKETTKMNNELKRALNSKQDVSNDNLNAQRKPSQDGEPKINPIDKTVLAGYTWDNARKAYKKLIAGGTKFMFVTSDLKKRWVENAK